MKKVILVCVLWLCGGLISALLKDLNVNSCWITSLHFAMGYFTCVITYYEEVEQCLEKRKKKKSSTQKN